MKARTIDITDADKIDIFDAFNSSKAPLKASSDTNIDIVNPIPARTETANTSNQLALFGFLVIPTKLAMYVNAIIPIGFPMTNPKTIPVIRGYSLNKFIEPLKFTPVLANANKGNIK